MIYLSLVLCMIMVHESQLIEMDLVEEGIELLKKHGHVYEKEGAIWFRATDFGDEKDRVLIRENGQPTYFAPDMLIICINTVKTMIT